MTVAGILLSAGASTRAGMPKALARVDGATFLERALGALAPVRERVIVVAPPHAGLIIQQFRGLSARFAHNPKPERGMLSSLQVGLAALPAGVDAAVVSLIDHPRVARATVQALIDVWRATRGSLIRPCFAGRRGHPIVLDRTLFHLLRAEPTTMRLRDALAHASITIDVDLDDPAVLEDIDRP